MMDHLTGTYQSVTIMEHVFKGSSKGLRCFKPREEEGTKDDEGWHQYRTNGEQWGNVDPEEEDDFYGTNEEDTGERAQEDPRELERQSYLARREQEQAKEFEARLKIRRRS